MLALVSLSLLALAATAPSTLAVPTHAEVEDLFQRRQMPIPDVGTDAWAALYPASGSTPSTDTLPQAWRDKLNAVIAAGLVPSPQVCPVATVTNGWPTYPAGLNALDPTICANTWGCFDKTDQYNAPDGKIGISQDDGPLPPGVRLYQFFDQHNISATHFYIGGNVKSNPDIFLQARALPGAHFAIHTWSHPYMTSLSNEQVLAEIGWTMQILADSNFGKIPAFWRPPFGDVDQRVRAIAREVFGLKTVIWNNDSEDWHIGSGQTESEVVQRLNGFINGPKSPGLITLQHVLNDGAVDAFITTWPQIQAQGWQTANIPDVWGQDWYKNAKTGTSDIISGISLVSSSGSASANSSSSAIPPASASSASASSASASSTVASSSASLPAFLSVTSNSASKEAASASASASAVAAAAGAKSGAEARMLTSIRQSVGAAAIAAVALRIFL